TGARRLAEEQRPDDLAGGTKPGEEHAEGNQAERSQSLHRQQEAEQFAPDIICVRARQGHAQQEPDLGRIKGAGVPFCHAANLNSACQLVKTDFWVMDWGTGRNVAMSPTGNWRSGVSGNVGLNG